ncbi:hypothetical protein AVV09_gp08 [Mycobacterium phage BrownCNA]|uniref:Uncharacterized protein n=1 Tax=Mycobacterium phage BrownCNA TaxID=1698252 RepID=A0A0K1Y6K2_9CAUD|nr:hypothetical protein AVV09_gp08 [Mycobacterium phage BrownCNA]AKY02721.1 hypothetical protein SEA_BROWNCNA_8 [Mycobacterium phage BrownCNA]
MEEARAALKWWRIHRFLAKEYALSKLQTDLLMAALATAVDTLTEAAAK